MTASDTSTHGGFSVLRKHATECLPPLVIFFLYYLVLMFFLCVTDFHAYLLQDMAQTTPTQELVAKDLHGYAWHFKHIFRGNQLCLLITLVLGDSDVVLII